MAAFFLCLVPDRAGAETVYVDDANPPFMYGKHGRALGIYPDLVREIYHRANLPVTVSAVPWKRALDDAANGMNSIAGVYQTPARRDTFAFTHLIYVEDLMVYQKLDHPVSLNSIDDLNGHTIGTVRGWNYGQLFNQHRKQGRFAISEAASDRQNMQMLAMGRVDMVIAIREAGNETLRRLGLDDVIKASQQPLFSYPTFIAVNRKATTATLIPVLNQAILDMRKDGTWTRIVNEALNHPVLQSD
ncbi:substrate-binding periplasmic protein [Thalassospira mesophila]|uniref:substrate-binding periplasmic protein n=1 Tax=Thalassospira mesophila TaxID=1293891 RepID=UPI0013027CD2|nr:transporter substrate-binding domain-containing protein [Thalassospira mesophila]